MLKALVFLLALAIALGTVQEFVPADAKEAELAVGKGFAIITGLADAESASRLNTHEEDKACNDPPSGVYPVTLQ